MKSLQNVKQQLRKTRKRIHPINIPNLPSHCSGPKIYATMAVCIMKVTFRHNNHIKALNPLARDAQTKDDPNTIPFLSYVSTHAIKSVGLS
jgi:hypothetical protein